MAWIKWDRLMPNKLTDRIPLIFVCVELVLEVFFELYVVFPTLFEPFTWGFNIHFGIGLFLLINFIGNFYLSIATDLTSGSIILPAVLKPDWFYCPSCMLNAPPRSSHCHICNRCVLKRDHHCVFTGKCVGYNNQRYFMMLLVFFFLGSLFANYLNIDYTLELMHQLSWKAVVAFTLPVLGWLLGFTESLSFLTCVQCSTCVLCLPMAAGLIYYHSALIARGQTTREWRKQIHGYNHGWKQNFVEVFGTRWYLIWLWPGISSPLPGDGIHFVKRTPSSIENVKDM